MLLFSHFLCLKNLQNQGCQAAAGVRAKEIILGWPGDKNFFGEPKMEQFKKQKKNVIIINGSGGGDGDGVVQF